MKKLLSILVLTLFTSGQALASVPFGITQTNYSNEPSFNFEVKIENKDNSIANLINGYIDIMMMADSEMNEKESALANLMLDAVKNKNIQLNSQNSGTWIQVDQSLSEFQDFLFEVQEITSLKTEESGDTTSYEFRFGDLAFANIEGKLVMADTNQTIFLHDEEISSTSISLKNDEILSIEGGFDNNDVEYSLSESNKTLTALSSSDLNSNLVNLDLNSSDHLYQDLKSENPAVYIEFTQLLNLVKNLFGEEIASEITEELDYGFAEDLPSYESIFNKQTALLVDLNESIIPEFTLAMAEMSTSEASQIMNLFDDEFITEFNDENFTAEVTNINSDLKRATIIPTETNAEADLFDIEKIVITYGLHEGNFIISNNADILTETKTVEDNQTFSNSTATKKSEVSTVSFVDFATISDQLSVYEAIMEKLDVSTTEISGLDRTKTILNEMGVWSGYSYLDGNSIKEESTFKLPVELLLNEIELGSEDIFYSYSYSYSPYSDVNESDWFYDDVSQAYGMFIIDTYDYETESYSYDFAPAKEISRGEFIQMIISAYELDYEDINQYGSDIFSDVPSDSYFNYAIGVAYEKGIIKGDDGANTFRPTETLNRAEAIQILYNASPLLNGKTSSINKFKDVPNQAWYANVVSVATQEAIVKGINPEEFAPSKNLNKAEAVTLLMRLVNNEIRF